MIWGFHGNPKCRYFLLSCWGLGTDLEEKKKKTRKMELEAVIFSPNLCFRKGWGHVRVHNYLDSAQLISEEGKYLLTTRCHLHTKSQLQMLKKKHKTCKCFFEVRSLKLSSIFSLPNIQKSFTHIQSFSLDLLTLFAGNRRTQEQKFTVKKKNLLQQNNKKAERAGFDTEGRSG